MEGWEREGKGKKSRKRKDGSLFFPTSSPPCKLECSANDISC